MTPVVMADDGDNLTPVNINSTTVLAAQWQAFKDGGDLTALEQVRVQIEESPKPPVKPTKRTNAGKP